MEDQRSGGEEWGPWVIHDGMGCPVPAGTIVEVVCLDRFGFSMRSVTLALGGSYSSWNWEHFPVLKRITRYRVKKPKGMRQLETILAEIDPPKLRKPVPVGG